MSKFARTLTLGVAATIMIAASTASYAGGCPRGYNGYNNYSGANYYGGNYNDNYGGYYKQGYYKKGYYKNDNYKHNYKKSTAPSNDSDAENDDDANADETSAEVSTESQLFEIADKSQCKADNCTNLVLRDASGNEIEVSEIEYDDGLAEDTSASELSYHLSQNGSAVRGRLTPTGEEDGETTYSFVVEKIYS